MPSIYNQRISYGSLLKDDTSIKTIQSRKVLVIEGQTSANLDFFAENAGQNNLIIEVPLQGASALFYITKGEVYNSNLIEPNPNQYVYNIESVDSAYADTTIIEFYSAAINDNNIYAYDGCTDNTKLNFQQHSYYTNNSLCTDNFTLPNFDDSDTDLGAVDEGGGGGGTNPVIDSSPTSIANDLLQTYGCDATEAQIMAAAVAIYSDAADVTIINSITNLYNAQCIEEEIIGCMDESSALYNPLATISYADSCTNYDYTTPTEGDANNSDLIAGLTSLDGNYGDLIDDTILLIQNLQTAYETAVGLNPDGEDVAALSASLTEATAQLQELLGTEGILNAINNAVSAAENGSYDSAILQALIDNEEGVVQNDANLIGINQALITISAYANTTSNYGQISEELVQANIDLTDAQTSIEYLLDGLNQDGTSTGSYSEQLTGLNAILDAIEGALSGLTATTPNGGTAPSQDGNTQTDVALLVTSYNALVSTYNTLAGSDNIMTDEELEASNNAAAESAVAALTALGIPVTIEGLATYVSDYIAENNLVASQDVMMSTADYEIALQGAIDDWIFDNSALTELQAQNITDAAVIAAVNAANAASSQIISGLEADLEIANTAINNLNEALATATAGGTGGNDTTALDNAYAQIDQLILDAETQFQEYENDIAAYEEFLSGLGTSMERLEFFLSNNYGYETYDTSTIPSATSIPSGLAGNADFMTQQYVPQFSGGSSPNVYMNFAGKMIGVSKGFKSFSGMPKRQLNASGDITLELNDTTKKVMWGVGLIAVTFGVYKLINKK